ncbi:hypothetical protein [Faecalicoccus pleomorphus]|uniref:hypothetical protein n=1 Tax=Faecalicoccus pleomorphus TaxID=1323 RepID=UPI0029434DC6|nr:hypothetical protein [Faecalicoccus pleomorphus]
MYFDISNIVFGDFNNATHLSNHLNYLLHTDADQKFTNEDSVGNVLLQFDKNNHCEATYWNEDLKERKKQKNKIFNDLRQQWDSLYFTRIECPKDEIFHWNNSMVEEMFEIIQELQDIGVIVVLAEVHDDQPKNYCHFHLICKNIEPILDN